MNTWYFVFDWFIFICIHLSIKCDQPIFSFALPSASFQTSINGSTNLVMSNNKWHLFTIVKLPILWAFVSTHICDKYFISVAGYFCVLSFIDISYCICHLLHPQTKNFYYGICKHIVLRYQIYANGFCFYYLSFYHTIFKASIHLVHSDKSNLNELVFNISLLILNIAILHFEKLGLINL